MLTHAIDPEHAIRTLGINRADAKAMIRAGRLPVVVDTEGEARLRLFVSILIRLEWRLQHDSLAIREALCGGAPADLLGGSVDDLRTIRRATEAIEVPRVKWWRVGQ